MSTELLCGIIAVVALVKGIAIGWFAGLQRGLYLGEKGRRQAAESLLVLGVPEAPAAKRVRMGKLPAPLEPGSAPAGYDPRAIDRGMNIMREEFKMAGEPLPPEKELRRMAESMLSAAVFGPEDDIAIAGA
ncbi:MAG TPA: hypothetical protein VKC15_12525 [Gemmatimonadales bacterium]|nr:hypothetical protein [Gemmatimonadales bacterium]